MELVEVVELELEQEVLKELVRKVVIESVPSL